MNRLDKIFASLVLTCVLIAFSGCSADGAVGTTNNVNNATDAGGDVSGTNNLNNTNNQNNLNNLNNVNNEVDMGGDVGEPPKISIPTTFVPTNGGGTSTSGEHELTISVGTPQPYGQAENAEHKLTIGPIIPTGEN